MRRHGSRGLLGQLVAATVVALAVPAMIGGLAGAQTTTPTTPTTTPTTPTTTPTTSTSAPATTLAPTTTPVTPTTQAPAIQTEEESSSDIPWIPIAIGVAVLAALLIGLIVWARRRGARRQALADWRERAASTTAEAGATARLLSSGTPVTREIAQQVLTSLRAFEDLGESAPDEETRTAADRGRRALQSLGIAIDSDYRTRRSEPPADQDRLDASESALRNTATEADRTLRRIYRGFSEPD